MLRFCFSVTTSNCALYKKPHILDSVFKKLQYNQIQEQLRSEMDGVS
jgi:hypothetical protein